MDKSVGFVMKPDVENKTNIYSTQCNKCVFVLKDLIGDHKQIGCSLGRLDKFEDQGTKIDRDEENGQFIINGRICNTLRLEDNWEHENLPITERALKVLKEVEIPVDLILYIDGFNSLDDIMWSIRNIEIMTLKPKKIHCIVNTTGIKPTDVIKILTNSPLNNEIEWSVSNPIIKKKDMESCIDFEVQNFKNRYYTVFKADKLIPFDFLEKINYHLNIELSRFSLLESDDYPNGIFVSTALHKHPIIVGNVPVTYRDSNGKEVYCRNIIEKIKFIATEDEKPYMVQNLKDIV